MRIKRSLYHEATLSIIDKVKLKYSYLGSGKILVAKEGRKLYIEVAGKNLPYLGSHGEEVFLWETYIPKEKLERIQLSANSFGAESWIAFCYVIIKPEFEQYFANIIQLENLKFGLRLIQTRVFRQYMQPRSPSWSVVDLPRKQVPHLTKNLDQI